MRQSLTGSTRAWRRSTNVRLEVGIAHRYNVGETIQINDHTFNIYLVRFVQVAPVGDAHL